jgi:hypothetical protein
MVQAGIRGATWCRPGSGVPHGAGGVRGAGRGFPYDALDLRHCVLPSEAQAMKVGSLLLLPRNLQPVSTAVTVVYIEII